MGISEGNEYTCLVWVRATALDSAEAGTGVTVRVLGGRILRTPFINGISEACKIRGGLIQVRT